jgi:hypothetical protein
MEKTLHFVVFFLCKKNPELATVLDFNYFLAGFFHPHFDDPQEMQVRHPS